jgi:hypothetical protein
VCGPGIASKCDALQRLHLQNLALAALRCSRSPRLSGNRPPVCTADFVQIAHVTRSRPPVCRSNEMTRHSRRTKYDCSNIRSLCFARRHERLAIVLCGAAAAILVLPRGPAADVALELRWPRNCRHCGCCFRWDWTGSRRSHGQARLTFKSFRRESAQSVRLGFKERPQTGVPIMDLAAVLHNQREIEACNMDFAENCTSPTREVPLATYHSLCGSALSLPMWRRKSMASVTDCGIVFVLGKAAL